MYHYHLYIGLSSINHLSTISIFLSSIYFLFFIIFLSSIQSSLYLYIYLSSVIYLSSIYHEFIICIWLLNQVVALNFLSLLTLNLLYSNWKYSNGPSTQRLEVSLHFISSYLSAFWCHILNISDFVIFFSWLWNTFSQLYPFFIYFFFFCLTIVQKVPWCWYKPSFVIKFVQYAFPTFLFSHFLTFTQH